MNFLCPKVSVVIPLYNKESYICECIESVLKQTYTNIEIIVVDDGSTDGSLAVLKEYVYRNSIEIKIISQKNHGASNARNLGIQNATGEYIQFLDADDKLDENKIQVQMELLRSLQYPKDVLVFSKWTTLGKPLEEMGQNQKSVWHNYENPIYILVDFTLNQCCLPPCVYLIPNNLIKKVGGWDETLTLNDDGEFFARVINQTSTLRFTDKSLAYYRSTPNSVSKTINPKAAYSWVRSLIATSDIIINRKHPQSKEAVCKMLSSCLSCLYPYYRKQRKQGEEYLQKVFPDYVVKYPRLHWKEFFYWGIQYIKKSPNI